MALTDFYDDAARPRGGRWVKLSDVGDKIIGAVVDIEIRDRRDLDGNVVLSRKSGKARKEYVVVLEVDETEGPDDDGIRKVSCNESAQTAIIEAFRKAGGGDIAGARFALQVTAAAADKFSQASYAASIKKAARPVTVPVDELI